MRVAAPTRLDDDAVRLAVIKRLPWIKQQRQQFKDAERQSEREMVTGESHYVWGNRYRLKIVDRPGRTHFEVDGDRLVLYTPPASGATQRRAALDRWYREQLRHALPAVIATWEDKLGLSVQKWTIRRMKTKWGSCNRENQHIWFNAELAKKHPDCLEYIVLLIKGFEYDHVIIANIADISDACNLYVALSRARKSVTIIGPSPLVTIKETSRGRRLS